jgi:hypothetical protein
VIVVMLRTPPRRLPEFTADSGGGRSLRSGTSGAQFRNRAHASADPVAEAYGKFLDLPVPVVLAVLWLLGVVLLGTVLMAGHSVGVWLTAAIALS